ncbi:MAG: hypothetical protein QG629_731 [Patescibacteria group bacterium]|nr:dTMP kinase [Candidatus Saccharibacteria bacterium]MDQ5963648.1 hypothetical protein [Patescibacteria group bacterium]
MNKGKYIVIEGLEGVGKTTMVQMLGEKLASEGIPVKVMREPESQNDLTARTIRHLTQDPRYPMSTRTEVLLYNAARSQSLEVIRQAVENGVTCLVDRSYLTTLAIQYYGRGDVQDYQKINEIIEFAVGDMQPDLLMVLDAPVEVVRERTKNRYSADRFDNLDAEFLERVRAGYLWEAKQRGLPLIYATGGIDEVFAEIYTFVQKCIAGRTAPADSGRPQSIAEVLAHRTAQNPAEMESRLSAANPTQEQAAHAPSAATTTESWLHKNKNGSTSVTVAGESQLEPIVTSTTSDVYAFTEKVTPITIAAAMARLSRRGDDMRVTLLDEFIGKDDKDGKLLQRVITAYGDDSVQQLVGQHIVVENASNLLTKKLEWGRLAAYLEQSTRYIYFDQKDEHGKYRYHTPTTLSDSVQKEYERSMDAIFDIYSALVEKMTEYIRSTSNAPKKEQDAAWRSATKAQACDAIRPLLPVATKSTVGIYASGQALESLIMHLLADDLAEAREVGQKILEESRKVIPVILERADKPERGGAMVAYRANTHHAVRDLAEELLPAQHTSVQQAVSLVDYTPRNELDVVPYMLYEHNDASLVDIKNAVQEWSYKQKLHVFTTYMGERLNRRQKPGRALENISYTWDLVCDYGIFRDLQRHRMVSDLTWQQLTPRLGYETPSLVEEAGLSDAFDACFDISLQLHSKLVAAGYTLEAQYATLLGHKMRWKVTMNAREAFHFNELRTSPQGHPGYRKLVLEMHEKIAEVHPNVAGAMRFVNQDEDPSLTRLAAEKYTQFKLSQLG